MLLVVNGPGNFPGTSAQVGKLFLSVMLTWLAGPSIASLVVTGLVDGKAGYRDWAPGWSDGGWVRVGTSWRLLLPRSCMWL